MGSINSDEIISILRSEIEDYDVHARDQEVGTVIGIGDGIATIYGIDHAMYGEIVIFDNGVKVWYRISDGMTSAASCLVQIKRLKRDVRLRERRNVPVSRLATLI